MSYSIPLSSHEGPYAQEIIKAGVIEIKRRIDAGEVDFEKDWVHAHPDGLGSSYLDLAKKMVNACGDDNAWKEPKDVCPDCGGTGWIREFYTAREEREAGPVDRPCPRCAKADGEGE